MKNVLITFCLLVLFGCGKQNGKPDEFEIPTSPESPTPAQSLLINHNQKAALFVDKEVREVLIKVKSLGNILGQYESQVRYHPFGRVFPPHTGIDPHTLDIGCNIITKTFQKAVLDREDKMLGPNDLTFKFNNVELKHEVIQEEPLILAIDLPHDEDDEVQGKKEIHVLNNTQKPFIQKIVDIGDCYAKGYPYHGHDIVDLPSLEQISTNVMGGKEIKITLIETLP